MEGAAMNQTENKQRLISQTQQKKTGVELQTVSITKGKLKWTINILDPFKTCGPDDIFPVLLQRGTRIAFGNSN